jgi:sporulation protein YlmC with PRC-barrel domain
MVPNRDGNVYVQKMREQLPPGEVAIHQGAKVISFSNKMKYGKATAFQIDPKSHRVANLICQNGFPWRRKQISIPASQIKFIGDHTIYLKWNEQKIPVGS